MTRGGTAWAALVPVVALAAGLLFATSSQTAQGTDLRGGEATELSALIPAREDVVAQQEEQLAALQDQVQALTDQAASRDGDVAAARDAGEAGALSAGLVALTGPGVEITLDDAPRRPDGSLPIGAQPDDVVIHQSDVQAVVNAVWASGADAVAIMGERLIATSAVRCVGNTLLLNGRVYSPPFTISAIGPASGMRIALNESIALQQYRKDAEAYGLGYQVREHDKLEVPAYDAPIGLSFAAVGG